MRKLALLFLLAIFVPSLVLAWLAMRSLRDQQFALERQQSLLYQKVADSIAADIQNFVIGREHEFAQLVEGMLPGNNSLATTFDDRIRTNWPYAQVGFVVTLSGHMLCPPPSKAPTFYSENGKFLCSAAPSEVYWNTKNQTKSGTTQALKSTPKFESTDAAQKEASEVASAKLQQKRSVIPQQQVQLPGEANDPGYSKVAPSEAEFRQIIGEQQEGTLARFSENKLNVLIWYRPPRRSELIFGAKVALPMLVEAVKDYVQIIDASLTNDICVALLDDSARPLARSHLQFVTNWRRPATAAEIGEELPHWEVAVYPLNPNRIRESARTARLTLGLAIAVLLSVIVTGSWLVVDSMRKELRLARQKTDFVSNVSHELKTPLTSIRMFSELLADGRVKEPEKQRAYLNIIGAETSRLARLINNVLDFARMERGEKKYHFERLNVVEVLRETCEMYRPHLEEIGFQLETTFNASGVAVNGDRDAMAQLFLNLLSNAEKYSETKKEISVTLQPEPSARSIVVTVADRGLGVPRGCEEKIFQQFYRAHDSLSSGIQGSGLGLTLARQIARAHGGDVTYRPREGGGSLFNVRLPVLAS